jgi:hypothetical protein
VTGCLAQAPDLGQHLVVKIDPALGLTQHHLEQARAQLGHLRL